MHNCLELSQTPMGFLLIDFDTFYNTYTLDRFSLRKMNVFTISLTNPGRKGSDDDDITSLISVERNFHDFYDFSKYKKTDIRKLLIICIGYFTKPRLFVGLSLQTKSNLRINLDRSLLEDHLFYFY